jgi:predicted ATPase
LRIISALIGAFEQLVNQLASSNDSRRQSIIQSIKSELGDLAQLIVLLVPFLETIIGKQTHIEDLPPDQSKNRLNSAIVKFIRSFSNTKPGQPLVIFIDDIQWADTLSVGLICELLTATPALSLLVVCTRRDTEAGQKICDKIIDQIGSTVQHKYVCFSLV